MVMRVAAACAAALLLAACAPTSTVLVPGPVEYRDRIVPEPVADELTQERPIPVGGIEQCLTVAAQRRYEIEAANAQLRAIRERHGNASSRASGVR